MIVVDTHAVIWWRIQSSRLSNRAKAALDEAGVVSVPDAVLFEIAALIHSGELRINVPAVTWLNQLIAEPSIEVVAIRPDIAAAAAALQQSLLPDPFDSLIAATAMRLGHPLITIDSRIQNVAAIDTIW